MKLAFFRSALAAAVLATGTAWAATPSEAQIDKLTDLVVQAMPFGQVFELVSAKDPNWPLGDKAGKATPAQLACLRGELSTEGYRRNKRKDVVAYAKAHPEDVANDIRLLEAGAAELFGKFVLAGAQGEATGKPADPEAIAASATAAQGVSLTALTTDPSHDELRELIGMGGMFDTLAAEGDDKQMQAKGEKQGTQLGVQLMLGAMQACELPLSALQ
jgi:hypothetical protein